MASSDNVYAILLCKHLNIEREARNSREQNLRTLPLFSIGAFKMISVAGLRIDRIFEEKRVNRLRPARARI